MSTLATVPHHRSVTIARVGGLRRFRRRLLEMGLTPGTEARVLNVAPLGDPIEIEVRGSRISIRHLEAASIEVRDE